MQTALFRQQHNDILQHLKNIDAIAATASEHDVCMELSRLAGIVKMHLTLEDKNLYPAMLKHESSDVRETAEEYQRTMGNLAPVYVAFHEKWVPHGAIEADRAGFLTEFRQVRDALRKRIELENRNLYNLVDARVKIPA